MSDKTDLINHNNELQNLSNFMMDIQNIANTLPNRGGSGDVKLFNTINEMQSSQGNQNGDLAVVYRNGPVNLTNSDKFQVAIFPETVVLPAQISNYIYISMADTNNNFFSGDLGTYELQLHMQAKRYSYSLSLRRWNNIY